MIYPIMEYKMIRVKLPRELWVSLKHRAIDENITLNGLMVKIAQEYISGRKAKKEPVITYVKSVKKE